MPDTTPTPAPPTPAPPAAGAPAPVPPATLGGLVRSAAVLAVIPLCLLLGLLVGAATRSRRRAANAMIGAWVAVGGRLSGVPIHVDHPERVDAARPAVVIFNHQSALDILVMCTVLRRDFTGVAKKELRRHPVFGPAFAFGGAVFLDRFDHARAVAALQPAVDTLRSGISIGIAPEGTRSPGPSLGPFKKGAFRLAMAAEAPLLPVVILNSYEALPRKAVALRRSPVYVRVLPPVPTKGWRLEDLDRHIAEVRALFARELEAWRQGRARGAGAAGATGPGHRAGRPAGRGGLTRGGGSAEENGGAPPPLPLVLGPAKELS